jgi:hypothetical protein
MPRAKKETAPEVEGAEPAAKVNETKAEKFSRLGKYRTTNALVRIAQLETLGGSGYESTPQQRAAILAALRKGVDKVEAAFSTVKGDSKPAFDF